MPSPGRVAPDNAAAVTVENGYGWPTKYRWSQAGGALLASDEVAYTVGGRLGRSPLAHTTAEQRVGGLVDRTSA